MIYHLSIFLENKPGKLERITKIIKDNGIEIRGISLANSGEFGILKLIVSDPDKACSLLSSNNIAVKKRRIIASYIDDRAGSLHDFMSILSSNDINVEDCYGIVLERGNRAVIVVEIEKFPEAENILIKNGVTFLTDSDIY